MPEAQILEDGALGRRTVGACGGTRVHEPGQAALLASFGRIANPVLGALLVAVAVLILLGLDRSLEAILVGAMPDWLLELTTQF